MPKNERTPTGRRIIVSQKESEMKIMFSVLSTHSQMHDAASGKLAKPAAIANSDENLVGNAYAMALLQFALLALGLMTVTILDKVEGGESGLSMMAVHLMKAGLLVFLVPLVWSFFAIVVAAFCPADRARRIISITGSTLVFLIIGIVALSIL